MSNLKNISNIKKYSCDCGKFNLSSTTKNANWFNGNSNRPTFLITNSFLVSTQVRTSKYQTGATKIQFSNKYVNAFGKWQGAPGGSGMPLKNRF